MTAKKPPAKKAPAKKTDKKKRLMLFMAGGKLRRVTVPEHFKVTFGAVVPSAKTYDPGNGWALRLYDGTKQVGVICGVKEFIEEGTVNIVDRVTKTKRRHIGEDGPKGMKNAVVEAKIHQWENPLEPNADDEPQSNELLALAEGPTEGDAWEL